MLEEWQFFFVISVHPHTSVSKEIMNSKHYMQHYSPKAIRGSTPCIIGRKKTLSLFSALLRIKTNSSPPPLKSILINIVNTFSNRELSDHLCDSVNRCLTLVRLPKSKYCFTLVLTITLNSYVPLGRRDLANKQLLLRLQFFYSISNQTNRLVRIKKYM